MEHLILLVLCWILVAIFFANMSGSGGYKSEFIYFGEVGIFWTLALLGLLLFGILEFIYWIGWDAFVKEFGLENIDPKSY